MFIRKTIKLLLILSAVIVLSAGPQTAAKTSKGKITIDTAPDLSLTEAIFFAFDDYSIPFKDNLKLTLVQAKKYSENPVLRRGPEGTHDSGHALIYGSVIKIGDKFKMWYLGTWRNKPDNDWRVTAEKTGWWRPMCYAESNDGIHWTKPNLGLIEFAGSKKNNICLIKSEEPLLWRINDFLSVMYDEDDPDPARRYKLAYIAHIPRDEFKGGVRNVGLNEKMICAMICAVSADGLTWNVIGDRPCVNEKFEVSGLYRFGNFYYATGQHIRPWAWLPDGSKCGRIMTAFRSPDLLNWSSARAFGFVRPGQFTSPRIPGEQTHMGAGMWNRGNVVIGLYGMWQDGPAEKPKGAPGLYGTRGDLGLILTNDGIHFREPVPNFKTIPRGEPNQWDSIIITQGHAFANVDDKTYLWYGHWDCEGQYRGQEIGLAQLRRDGFGYLSQKDSSMPGHFITCLANSTTGSAKLFANVEGASVQSQLKVELLDAFDRPIEKYSGKNAATVTKSGVRQQINWPKSPEGICLLKKPFALKVSLPSSGNVKVYALYITE
ncbi:MAG: hypothetical protein JXB29_10790 [Sedimentisphaerales bacterium]|nr:hypothetical protein [Sedimentisphaerales bacterium]